MRDVWERPHRRPRGDIWQLNRKRAVFAAATAAMVSSLLLGCTQSSSQPPPTTPSAPSTPEASSAARASTTPAPWNTSLYGPSPEDLEREAKPAIYAAKAEAVSLVHEIAAQLPADSVAAVSTTPTGGVVHCGSGEMEWTGNGKITLKAPADPDRTVVIIGEHWKTKQGYRARYYRSADDGSMRVDINGPKHAGFVADLAPHGTAIDVVVGSACFTVPKGFIPYGDY